MNLSNCHLIALDTASPTLADIVHGCIHNSTSLALISAGVILIISHEAN